MGRMEVESVRRLRFLGTKVSAAAGAVTVVGLLVVNQGAAGSPTRASWSTDANRDCAVIYARIRALPKPTTKQRFIADTRSALRLAKLLVRQLSRIPVPDAMHQRVHKLLTNQRTQDRIFEYQLLPALTNGEQKRIQRAAKELQPLDAQFNRLARSLGARVCAENPSPQG